MIYDNEGELVVLFEMVLSRLAVMNVPIDDEDSVHIQEYYNN